MSAMKELYVLLNGQRIGVLSQDNHGRHAFQYDTAVQQGTPLSLSMPVRVAEWTGDPIEAYIDGVLPDSWDVRNGSSSICLHGRNWPNNAKTKEERRESPINCESMRKRCQTSLRA